MHIASVGALCDRLEQMREAVRRGDHRRWRQASAPDLVTECDAEHLSWPRRAARLTRRMCEAELPIIGHDERIVFTRTVPAIPPVYIAEDKARLMEGHAPHELGPISNICADWSTVLSQGLLGRRAVALATRERLADDPEALEFIDSAVETIDAVLDLANRYADAAAFEGRDDIAQILRRVPAAVPATFHEALQSLRLLHSMLWLSGHYHVGLGRLDQVLWPFLRADLESGRETIESAEELLAEFFISLNKDSDLYPGVQQGDNGQSLTVGGVARDGTCGVNELTWMVLRVALRTSMIDPKINLRIDPATDPDLLYLATLLTRRGLGFPQYSNDAVVIPALVAHGYALEDARNYTVAACWEFTIPGKGMEVVNIGAVSFPAAVDHGVRTALVAGGSFEDVLAATREHIWSQVGDRVASYDNLFLEPGPYYSVLMDGCLERGRDLSAGLVYNNYGIHGAASADAADALAAVKAVVYDEQRISGSDLLSALDSDFAGAEALRRYLTRRGPKVGNHDDRADALLTWLFNAFADACESVEDNGRGGRIRPGTGSAMYYIWLAEGREGMHEPVVGATADGRHLGDTFSANLAPAHTARVTGPTSVLQSFSKIDYARIYNGGPITIELADTLFADEDAVRAVAAFVRTFATLGCQQMQLNTVRLEDLRSAQAHPEQYRNLIVRVWGWSAYFVELAPEYQRHVMQRHMFGGV
ncbi:MAG: pyruvate formate-lyase [Anaerolineae bacterium]|nr:pyruvate formate-lyase [Anaerolineae bacterium]